MDWSSILAGAVAVLLLSALLAGFYFAYRTRRIAQEVERLVPPSGKFVTVDGARIHYVEMGEGRPILMIHGLGGQLHHMRRPLMEAFGAGYRLIAMDRPGSGYSTRSKGDGRLSEQARFIARFIDELGLERPLLVGHSLGGAIALATALDYPDKISGLALIAPLTHPIEQVPPEFGAINIRSPILRWLVAHTVAVPLSVRNAPRTLAFVFGPQAPPPDFAVAGGAMVNLRPSHFYGTSTDFVALRHEFSEFEKRYEEINIPVGIIHGDADQVLDHRIHGLAMRDRIASLDLEIVGGVGHMVQYSQTGRTVSFIRRIAERAFAP